MIKELEDYAWFPNVLRRWQLQFVGAVSVWTRLYRPLIAELQQMTVAHTLSGLQDLCSGSGMPAVYVYERSKVNIPLVLSDLFPETRFKNTPGISYQVTPVQVLDMKTVADTGYTMFNAFHHFSTAQQKEIVQNMAMNGAPFLIAEILEPGWLNVIKIFFTATVIQLLTAPFVQPFSPGRLLFTYLLPLNLFTVAYDGIISVLRSKTVGQYQQELQGISTGRFTITVNRVNNWKGNIVCIKGEPIK